MARPGAAISTVAGLGQWHYALSPRPELEPELELPHQVSGRGSRHKGEIKWLWRTGTGREGKWQGGHVPKDAVFWGKQVAQELLSQLLTLLPLLSLPQI